jgi:DNA excision repair protein ERCC-3
LSLIRDIQRWTAAYGKVKLVLKKNRYYLESSVPEMIQRLLADSQIRACRIVRAAGVDDGAVVHGVESAPKPTATGLVIPGTTEARRAVAIANGQNPDEEAVERDDVLGAVIGIDRGENQSRFHTSSVC